MTKSEEFKDWSELSAKERNAFFVGDEYLPLPLAHAQRIRVLKGQAAVELERRLLFAVPGRSWGATSEFDSEESIRTNDSEHASPGVQEIREWLHARDVPYSCPVYLLYHELVVATEWKLVVRYWDAFATNVGVEMVALDATKSWTCAFHHEDVITFSRFRLK